jgi:sodium-dependent dicarboxylate transporter 2/3/5
MGARMAGIAIWMAVWWMTEVVHLGFTSLLPMLLLPILGISPSDKVAAAYMDPILFLFMGGFGLSFAIERWHLHRRLSSFLLSKIPTTPSWILGGIMLITYMLSNWMSNTATCLMMLAVVMGIIKTLGEPPKFSAALLLGLAYSASIGGMATPVGTPPNLIFFKVMSESYPQANQPDFFEWSMIGFPLSFTLLLICFFLLKFFFFSEKETFPVNRSHFKEDLQAMGKMSVEEKWVGGVFLFTAIAWFTRNPIQIGSSEWFGWSKLFPKGVKVDDSAPALLAIFLLMIIPSRENRKLLSWEEMKKIPLDVLLIFGGGFALAMGFETSGLSKSMASSLSFLSDWPLPIMVIGVVAMVTLISEFASNVASIQLVAPILVALQIQLGLSATSLLLPATLAASIGFALPVATAANTIAFGTGKIPIKKMIWIGLCLDLAGIILISLFQFWL